MWLASLALLPLCTRLNCEPRLLQSQALNNPMTMLHLLEALVLDALHLAGHPHAAVLAPADVQAGDANGVTSSIEAAVTRVQDNKGEHAVQHACNSLTMVLPQVADGLAGGMRLKCMSASRHGLCRLPLGESEVLMLLPLLLLRQMHLQLPQQHYALGPPPAAAAGHALSYPAAAMLP